MGTIMWLRTYLLYKYEVNYLIYSKLTNLIINLNNDDKEDI